MSAELTSSERIERWVAALRSGKYEQVASTLNDQGAYCCLGVACALFHPEYLASQERSESSEEYLPQNYADELGLLYSDQVDLATMNDGGSSFASIADHIERLWGRK